MNKKFFDNTKQEGELAIEMIAQQQNDYVVGAITDVFEKIIANIKEYDLDSAKKVFTNRKNKPLIVELDSIISKRFGINLVHTSATGTGYAVWTIPPKNQNVLNKNILDVSEAVDEYTKNANDSNTHTNSKNIRNADTQMMSIMRSWKKSMDALEKTMNTNGVRIDLEKAVIYGLPKDYEVFIACDLDIMVNKLKMDANELTAVLLHEIGHAFTHIEYSYRSVSNTSVLIDTIQDCSDKNKSYKETLKLIYEDVLDGKGSDLDEGNEITATIKLADEYIKNSVGMIPTPHSGTDSEQLADQFAGRFGMGIHLITGLDKLHTRFPATDYFSSTLATAIMAGGFVLLFAVVLAAGVAGAFMIAIATTLTIMITGFIVSFLETLLTNGNTNNSKTYDDSKQRLVRIKNEMIRRIRTEKIDKNIKKAILEELDMVETIIKKTPAVQVSFSDKLIRLVNSNSKRLANMKEMEQVLENLMENDLHASAVRINLLKG